jgi:hypothetical protein
LVAGEKLDSDIVILSVSSDNYEKVRFIGLKQFV